MAQKLQLKRSSTASAVPTTGQLDLGEIAINTYDGKMYIKKDNGTASIVEITNAQELGTVDITTPALYDLLQYDGTKWVNQKFVTQESGHYIRQVYPPGTGATLALNGAGNVTGTFYYLFSYKMADGSHTAISAFGATITTSSNKVLISNIPVSSDPKVTARIIYRQQTNSTTVYKVDEIADNTTTTYVDDILQANLTTTDTERNGTQAESRGFIGVENYDGTKKSILNAGPNTTANLYFGFDSIPNTSSAYYNTAFGNETLPILSTGTGNTAMGTRALYRSTSLAFCTAIGLKAGQNITTASACIAIGVNALGPENSNYITGGSNIGIGYFSLSGNLTSGNNNIGIGSYANRYVNTGNYNIAIGRDALTGPTAGAAYSNQIFIGWRAGYGTSMTATSTNNVGIGVEALRSLTDGASNTAYGYFSGYSLTTGNNNNLTGYRAGYSLTTGSNNSYIGHYAGNASGTSTSNSTGIGPYANAEFNGEMAFSNGYASAVNDTKISMYPAWTQTTDATSTEIGVGGIAVAAPTDYIALTNDSTYMFNIDLIARNTGADDESAAWNVQFAIRRGTDASTTALIGSVTKTVIGKDTNASTWDVAVTADTTNGRPAIAVTGEASKTIRWVATIRSTKVTG